MNWWKVLSRCMLPRDRVISKEASKNFDIYSTEKMVIKSFFWVFYIIE